MGPKAPAKKTRTPKTSRRKKPTKDRTATSYRKGIDDPPSDPTRPPWPPPSR
jgi:hypothetical protein